MHVALMILGAMIGLVLSSGYGASSFAIVVLAGFAGYALAELGSLRSRGQSLEREVNRLKERLATIQRERRVATPDAASRAPEPTAGVSAAPARAASSMSYADAEREPPQAAPGAAAGSGAADSLEGAPQPHGDAAASPRDTGAPARAPREPSQWAAAHARAPAAPSREASQSRAASDSQRWPMCG